MNNYLLNLIPIPSFLICATQNSIIASNDKANEWIQNEKFTFLEKKISDFIQPNYCNDGEYDSVCFEIKNQFKKYGKLIIKDAAEIDNNKLIYSFIENPVLADNRFRKIFEQSIDGIVVTDRLLIVKEINPAFCKIVEIDRGQLINKNAMLLAQKFASPKSLKGLLIALKNITLGIGHSDIEMEYKEKVLSISFSIQKQNDYFIGTVRDVTEKVKAKQEIEKRELLYRKLFDSSIDAIITLDPIDLTITAANQSMIRMFSYSKIMDVIHLSPWQISPKLQQSGTNSIEVGKKLIALALKNGQHEFEWLHMKQNGEIFPCHIILTRVDLKTGPIINATIRDLTDLKEKEQQISESENKYKTLVETSNDSIAIIQDGLIKYVNPELISLSGYRESEMIGQNFMKFVISEEQERISKYYQKRTHGEKAPSKYETVSRTKNGENVHIEASLIPITYQGREAIQLILRNITEQKEAKLALIASEEKFKFLSKSTFEGIVIHKNGIINDVNEAFLKMTGYTKEETIGENLLDYVVNPIDKAKVLINIVKKNAKPYTIDAAKKDGTHFIAELEAKNVNHLGETVRIVAIRDVTEKHQFQQQLKESEERYRTVFENTGAASCIVEEDGTISLTNSKFAKLSGYSIKEIQNKKKWMQFVVEEDLENMMAQHQLRRINKQKALNQYEFRFRDRSNQIKNILIVIDMIDGTQKSIASLLDITEIKNAENKILKVNEELKLAKERAEENDQLKSAFLANMSHEIRTPMNGILGFTELLKEPDLTGDEKQMYIDVIQRSGIRMLDTVNDLIDISKIETGQMPVNKTQVNINAELEQLYHFFKPEAEKKGIELIWSRKFNKQQETIFTDDQKVNSILTNLIKNAIKYTDQGMIEIAGWIENNKIQISVKDTGIGIPKDRLEAVFNRFEQVDFKDSRAFEGSGLGLAISKAYVEMLGGEIWVESEHNMGSTFFFTLPY